MRNNNTSPIVYIGVLLVTLVILAAANMLKNQFSSEEAPGGDPDPGGICPEGRLFKERGWKQYFCKFNR